MNYFKLKDYIAMACLGLTVSFVACNNDNTTSDVSDSARTYTSVGPAPNSDTSSSSMQTNTDTTSMQPMQSMQSTDTSSASKTTTATSTSKRKGKASVEIATVSKNHSVSMDKSGVYEYADVMPAFPGGQSAIDNYVNNNINYPQMALDDDKEGRVSIAFTVDENGKVINAHSVGNKLGDGLDEEAVRVVSKMPNWKPGMVKGKAVKTKQTLPIIFRVEG